MLLRRVRIPRDARLQQPLLPAGPRASTLLQMSSSNLDRRREIPRQRMGDCLLLERDLASMTVSIRWQRALSRAAETWAMVLGASVPPAPHR